MKKRVSLKKAIQEKWHILALVVLICVISVSHILYVLKTYQYPQWDENVYLQHAIEFLSILQNPTVSLWQEILETTQHRQPFYPLFISIPLLIFGTYHAYKIALLVNGIFYVLSILFTYLLSKQFFSRLPSFLAAYMFAFYGFPLFYLHFVMEETAATAFVIMALYFLKKNDVLLSKNNTILLSLAASIGTLVRWIVPVFLIGAFLSMFYKIPRSQIAKHITILFIIGVLPAALLYYYPNHTPFLEYAEVNRIGGPQWVENALKNPFSKTSIIWYASVLAQQTIFFWTLFVAGFILSIVHFRKYLFLLLAFSIPYLFLTFASTWKDDRFIVPSYPMMAIISAVVIYELRNTKLKIVIIFLTLLLGFLNFLGASWGIGPMKFSIHGNRFTVPHSVVVPMPIGHPRRVWLAPMSWPPRVNEGNSDIILRTVLDDSQGKKPNVLLTFFIPQIEGPLYTTVLYERRELLTLQALWGFRQDDYSVLFDRIKQANYVLIKVGGQFDNQPDDQADLLQTFNGYIKMQTNILPQGFAKMRTVSVPFDRSTVEIYKRTREITPDDWDVYAAFMKHIYPQHEQQIVDATGAVKK